MIEIIIWAFVIWVLVRIADLVVSAVALKEAETQIRDHLDKIIHDVVIEKHHDTEYWFDKETDQFLAQGQTREELTNHLKSRFPNHIFVLASEGIMCAPEWKLTKSLDPLKRAEHYGAIK